MCYYIITKEKSPVTRVSDHFFTNTSYKGCTLFVRRIRLLSFGTASGHIMYKGYDPPVLQVRNMIYDTVFMGFLFFSQKICGASCTFSELEVHKVRLRSEKAQPACISFAKKTGRRGYIGIFRSMKYTKYDCALKKHNLLASLLRKNFAAAGMLEFCIA